MQLYHDHASGGQWFHCDNCGRAGDMIELAAAAWRLSLEETVLKLRSLDFPLPNDPEPLRAYLSQHVGLRERIDRLWRSSQQEMLSLSTRPQRLLGALNLRCEIPPERWQDGPGQLLGASDTTAVEQAFFPGSMQQAEARNRHNNPSANRIFRGGLGRAIGRPVFRSARSH
jgi:hypothetical protein